MASLLFAIAWTTEALISREAGLIVAFTAISFYFLFRLRHPIGVVYILLTAAGIWGLPALLGERIARGVIIPGLIFFGAAATPTLLLWLRSRRKNEWEELPWGIRGVFRLGAIVIGWWLYEAVSSQTWAWVLLVLYAAFYFVAEFVPIASDRRS